MSRFVDPLTHPESWDHSVRIDTVTEQQTRAAALRVCEGRTAADARLILDALGLTEQLRGTS